jgi:hypothetical protein
MVAKLRGVTGGAVENTLAVVCLGVAGAGQERQRGGDQHDRSSSGGQHRRAAPDDLHGYRQAEVLSYWAE